MGEGPDVRRLGRRETAGLKRLMDAAAPPSGLAPEVAAAALLEVIGEQVDLLRNANWRAAASAALRRPPEHYLGVKGASLSQRLITRAEFDRGKDFGEPRAAAAAKEAYRGYWTACAVLLGRELERVFARMAAEPASWDRWIQHVPPNPVLELPISFDRTDVIYTFSGRVGVRSTSYRWLVAHEEVDHYDAVGWYYNEPDASVEIVPVANCVVTTGVRDLPLGGRAARLEFSHLLSRGEEYFFAYSTVFNSQQPCRPAILYEVKGRHMSSLVVRAQFDPAERPAICWYYDMEQQSDGWQEPAPSEILAVSVNGYVEHEFVDCRRGRRYGLRWRWDD